MNVEEITNEMIEEVALKVVDAGIIKQVERVIPTVQKKVRKKRVSNKPTKGKTCVGKFWSKYDDQAMDIATDDNIFPESIRTGNYALTKQFFQNDFKCKKEFTLKEFRDGLNTKYADTEFTEHNGQFRIQIIPWSEGMFYELSGELQTKPIFKKISRGLYQNIFYIPS